MWIRFHSIDECPDFPCRSLCEALRLITSSAYTLEVLSHEPALRFDCAMEQRTVTESRMGLALKGVTSLWYTVIINSL